MTRFSKEGEGVMDKQNYDTLVMARVTTDMRNHLQRLAKDRNTTETYLLRQGLLYILNRNGIEVTDGRTWLVRYCFSVLI